MHPAGRDQHGCCRSLFVQQPGACNDYYLYSNRCRLHIYDAGGGSDNTSDSDADTFGMTALFTAPAEQTDVSCDVGLIHAPDLGFAFPIGSPSNSSVGESVATDASGNVYVTGYFQDTVDFDPGPATFNLTSAGYADIFVAKYSATGALLWADSMGAPALTGGSALSRRRRVYVTGSFSGTADFAPGQGVYNLASAGGADVFVCKLDSAGNVVWVRDMGGTNDDLAYRMALAAMEASIPRASSETWPISTPARRHTILPA